MIFGAILAGGVGSRMNIESMPKQFLPLGAKPVFMHTVEKFALCSEFDAIFIGVHKDWLDFAKDLIAAEDFGSVPVRAVRGGEDRSETIMRIISAIEAEYGESEDHVIVTHDSVRPFVKLSTIKKNIEVASEFGACDTVIPATDTIVVSQDGRFLDSIPLRNLMYQGQTPQSFKMSSLKKAYENLSPEKKRELTDACKVFVAAGLPVAIVEGDPTNIKLTTIMDYKVAQAMLESGIES